MDLSETSRQSLLPSFLYSPSASRTAGMSQILSRLAPVQAPPPLDGGFPAGSFVAQAPNESRKIKMYSPAFYAACTAGGIASCGLTHMTVTPLDLVKCNMQIDPIKYKSISSGFGARLQGLLQGMGAHPAGLQCPGGLQVWFLRVLQEVLLGHCWT